MRMLRLLAGAAAFIGAATPAFAHAGFLYPVLDDADGSGEVILEASFSDVFPVADVALKATDWAVIDPAGHKLPFDGIAETDSRTLLQVTLDRPGTFRFTSGERLGRKGEIARVDGEFVRIGGDGIPKAELPERAEILSSQTATVSDLYLRRGDGDATFNAAPIGRLSIVPLSDPTGVVSGSPLMVEITFDGEPLAGQPLTLFTSTDAPEGAPATTDERGRFAWPLLEGQGSLLLVRHIAMAPEGADTDVRSYTTTLSISPR